MGQAGPICNKYFHPGSESYLTKIIFQLKVNFFFLGGRGGEDWGKREDAKQTENDGQLVDKGSSEVEMKASISLQTDKFMHCTRMSQAVIIKRIKDT